MKATIVEIGLSGHLDVTVARIARRAGMSSALAHHYFGGKAQMLLAAMRHLLRLYGAEVRTAQSGATAPLARLEALVRANFAPSNFRREAVRAWLSFYVLAESDPEARRLMAVYHRRLRSNLLHELRRLCPDRAEEVAARTGALIDGVYLREALAAGGPGPEAAARLVLGGLSRDLAAGDLAAGDLAAVDPGGRDPEGRNPAARDPAARDPAASGWDPASGLPAASDLDPASDLDA